jgi:hypothetical protein
VPIPEQEKIQPLFVSDKVLQIKKTTIYTISLGKTPGSDLEWMKECEWDFGCFHAISGDIHNKYKNESVAAKNPKGTMMPILSNCCNCKGQTVLLTLTILYRVCEMILFFVILKLNRCGTSFVLYFVSRNNFFMTPSVFYYISRESETGLYLR